ncbi:MAG: hemerythrin domain-containing protein [Pirellulales bacterium]|nr:hemerythrin domain-containing protein [Pirellulales bacterium]
MADEEAIFVDLLSDELQLRLLTEHEALRSLLNTVRQQLDANSLDIDELAKLAALWRAHIRWEERHLYPYLETHVSPDELQVIGDRLRQNVHDALCSVTPDHLGTVDEISQARSQTNSIDGDT